jgi:predicted amidohydrolase
MRISAVQFRVLKDPEANLRKAEFYISAESKKSDLIVFPEYFIGSNPSDAPSVIARFRRLAKKYRVDLVAGSIATKRGGRIYNTSHYIDSRGRVLARYDKARPWSSEKVTPGGLPKIFRTRFGKTALVICWDLSSSSISSHTSRIGVDLIICPAMWWRGGEAAVEDGMAERLIDSLCTARAYENRACLIYANQAGTLRLSRFSDLSAGSSQIITPTMSPIRAKGRKEQVVRSKFDSHAISMAKRYFGHSK